MKNNKIKIGVSSCLLGEKVRYNGEHKQDRYVRNILSEYFEWVPTCPEVEVGMGVPRETVRLEGTLQKPQMVGSKSGENWTARMNSYSKNRLKKLKSQSLSGYIFQKGSPSCGIERVKIFAKDKKSIFQGAGLFADAFMKAFPLIPVEEEGRLHDHKIRENFIVRVFAYHQLQEGLLKNFTRGNLVKFHARHKYLLLAHSPKHYSSLGRLVAGSKKKKPSKLKEEYSKSFMEALGFFSTRKKNANVLQHIHGFLKDKLEQNEKYDILENIRDYQNGLLPLIAPILLLKHYVKKYKIQYLLGQSYLSPHPKELMLRNHV